MNLQIELLDPKAKRLLEDLADLGIIKIKEGTLKEEFKVLLHQLRGQEGSLPTMDEITAEVEAVRSARYRSRNE